MFLLAQPSAVFGTNCYVVAPTAGEECLVVDPGIEILPWLDEVLREHALRPAAVLLTHGHIDHVYSVTPVCGGHDVPSLIHTDDEYRLTDPYASLDQPLVDLLTSQFGPMPTWAKPDRVQAITDAQTLTIAGLEVDVIHAPGHTEGSVMFRLPGVPDAIAQGAGAIPDATLLSGDVLFQNSIGRTDYPGGDHQAMLRSLRTTVLTQPDATLVLPGHGPATTIARERANNPYLQQLS